MLSTETQTDGNNSAAYSGTGHVEQSTHLLQHLDPNIKQDVLGMIGSTNGHKTGNGYDLTHGIRLKQTDVMKLRPQALKWSGGCL